jgi:hypothetical protein
MTDYLVYNDLTGEFAAADAIIAVLEDERGALILLRNRMDVAVSPLKPRELLRRLTIMRFKRENGDSTQKHPRPDV